MSSSRMSNTQRLMECSLLIAIGTVLAQIKLFRMPGGGSVTALSMLPFIMISFRHGLKWGIMSGLTNSVLQMALGGLYMPPAGTFAALTGSVLLDYILAYTGLGAACVMGGKKGNVLLKGTAAACMLRFVCSFLSGFLIWSSLAEGLMPAALYSLSYNASYLLPESVLTCLGALYLNRLQPGLFARQ